MLSRILQASEGIGVPQHSRQLLARGLGPGLIYAGLSGSSLSLSSLSLLGVVVPEVYSSQENQQKCDV